MEKLTASHRDTVVAFGKRVCGDGVRQCAMRTAVRSTCASRVIFGTLLLVRRNPGGYVLIPLPGAYWCHDSGFSLASIDSVLERKIKRLFAPWHGYGPWAHTLGPKA